jgi:hypothetical protein
VPTRSSNAGGGVLTLGLQLATPPRPATPGRRWRRRSMQRRDGDVQRRRRQLGRRSLPSRATVRTPGSSQSFVFDVDKDGDLDRRAAARPPNTTRQNRAARSRPVGRVDRLTDARRSVVAVGSAGRARRCRPSPAPLLIPPRRSSAQMGQFAIRRRYPGTRRSRSGPHQSPPRRLTTYWQSVDAAQAAHPQPDHRLSY